MLINNVAETAGKLTGNTNNALVIGTNPASIFKDVFNIQDENFGFDEDLKRINEIKDFDNYGTYYRGEINGKEIDLKYNVDEKFLGFNKKVSFKGTVDSKDFEASIEWGRTIKGKIDGREFEFELSNVFDKNILKGTIDGKEIIIDRGSKLDAAQGEEDLLTLIYSLAGKEFKIEDGEFKGMKASEQSKNDMEACKKLMGMF